MASIAHLGVMDLNSAAESLTLNVGITFSGSIEPHKIQQACTRVTRAWPILGARLRQNDQTEKIEVLVPDPNQVGLDFTSKTVDSKLAEVEKLHVRTSTISTQKISRNACLYRNGPLLSLRDYLSSGIPVFKFHAAHLLDATILTLTFAHILMDARGCTEVIKAIVLALDQETIPPILTQDPWAKLLPDALRAPSDPDATKGWAIWDSATSAAMREAEQADFEADGPSQQRVVYFPGTEITRLKKEALEELHAAGYDLPFLSTSDVVAAWLYKHTFIDNTDTRDKNRFIYVVDARDRFPDAFLPGHVYLHNAFFNMATFPLTDTELHSMTLGEIARTIRLSVARCTTREPLLSQMKWKYEHAGQTQIPFSPRDRMQFASSWLSFDLGNLSITKHVKEGTGTGQVLDVIYDAKNSARCTSAIKFKDTNGGIVCEMDWGTKRWTSGEMAKYALENLTR